MSMLLKAGLHRTVRVEDPAGERARVVKRFERGGPLGWIRDRRNARREFELLAALFERGLPVPRPFELRRVGAGFEVAMERIDGCALLDLCTIEDPAGSAELARDLGRLLARLQAAGLDHPDIHARNVLVRPGGELVAIDFHAARLRAPRGHGWPATWRRDLVVATAGLRDVTSRTFRARAFRSWYDAAVDALGDPPAESRALARAIEAEARLHRRTIVAKRRRRWTRVGTACRAFEHAGVTGLVDRGLGDRDVERLAEAIRAGREPILGTWLGHTLRTTRKRAQAIHENAARLAEHGVRAARPCALVRRPEPLVVLALPQDSRSVASADDPPSERSSPSAQLAECGLALGTEPTWWRLPNGELWLGAVERLDPAPELGR